MSKPELYADIILPLPLDQVFTYHVPEEIGNRIASGQRAVVQFGARKLYAGIVRKVHSIDPGIYDLKEIAYLLDEKPVVNEIQLSFWEWMSDYYMCPVGEVFKSALPSGLKLESESCVFPDQDFDPDSLQDKRLNILYKTIQENPGTSIRNLSRIVHRNNILADLRYLVDRHAAFLHEKIHEGKLTRTKTMILLNPALSPEPEFRRALERLSKAGKQEKALTEIAVLSGGKQDKISQHGILQAELTSRYGYAVVKALLDKGFIMKKEVVIELFKEELVETKDPEKLSSAQKSTLESIREKFIKKDVVLLHGITSSGKTEIYFHLIRDTIESGKQVLYLLPEIAITSQMINRLRKVFGNAVGIYHSRFSDAERVAVYNHMTGHQEGGYKIILGVRSAIFLPFRKLGLIIVDEEHENTYKQFDPAPRYNARDSSIVLAKLHGAKVLLGTATPSVETYANCIAGKYDKVVLRERYRNIMLPEIIISDILKARKKKSTHSVFTTALIEAIESTISKKKQVILFQNRRGFSTYVECQACGWIPKCKLCDVSLIYHKYNNSLVCHYCGYKRKLIDRCDRCGVTDISSRGFGTERIEDDIKLIFPGIRVARLDLDTARSADTYEKVLQAFGKGEVDILVGTQMISKGLDFENVALVGIINADQMLNYPDFRAFERSYQLMAQVSGRAGRKDERGKVIIQTTDPSNPVIRYVRENDYEAMFSEQIRERELFKYPPFVRMIRISVRHKNPDQLTKGSKYLSDKLRLAFGNRVYGPQSPLVGRISNYYIMDILLKIEKQLSFSKARGILKDIIREGERADWSAGMRIIPDVDPL